MNVLKAFHQYACLAVLSLMFVVGVPANRAHATNEYFDVNGSTTGSGVAVSGSYTFEASNFNTNSTGGAGTITAWPNGNNFMRFSAGTDAIDSSYTVTAGTNHTFAGMVLQADGGGTVTIASSGGSVLSLCSNSGGQGFFVGGFNTQNLQITAPIGGDAITPLVWQGAISTSQN